MQIIHTVSNGMKRFLEHIEGAVPLTLGIWLVSFISLIVARLLVEGWLSGFADKSGTFLFYEFAHTFLFFLLAYLLFWPFVMRVARVSRGSAMQILFFGFLIILTPPLIDAWVSSGQGFWSFYKFDGLVGLGERFLTFFGDRPDIGITYGVRVEVALVILFLAVYTYSKTHQWSRVFLAALGTYAILFVLGTFPSWLALLGLGWSQGFLAVNDVDVARIFLTPPQIFARGSFDLISSLNIKMSLVFATLLPLVAGGIVRQWFPKIFLALLKNARWPQMIYHGGLLAVGMGLAIVFTGGRIEVSFFNILAFLVAVIAIECAWLASVVVNDLFDQRIDAITNPRRPLPESVFISSEYATVGGIFFFVSIFFGGLVSFKLALLLLAYQALAWMYSAYPFRLKRFPLVGTFFAAWAGLLIIFGGFLLIAPDGSLERLPLWLTLFFLVGYTLALPIKDFKDIEGDRTDGVYTLPVILGEHWGRIVVGGSIFLLYLASVWLFHEPRLFFLALLFGAVSFWMLLTVKKGGSWFSFRYLAGWMLVPIILYGLILVGIVF